MHSFESQLYLNDLYLFDLNNDKQTLEFTLVFNFIIKLFEMFFYVSLHLPASQTYCKIILYEIKHKSCK